MCQQQTSRFKYEFQDNQGMLYCHEIVTNMPGIDMLFRQGAFRGMIADAHRLLGMELIAVTKIEECPIDMCQSQAPAAQGMLPLA